MSDTRKPLAITLALAVSLSIALSVFLTGCGGDVASSGAAAETLSPRPWLETLAGDGEIKAAASTPLNVPGNNWSQRILVDMVADGSSVEKGQVVARFDSPQSRMELSQAELELLRKTLAEQTSASAASVERDKLAGDRAKVEDDLGLSRRYANVDLSIFPRNDILDALADVGFLTTKRTYLEWKGGQAQARTAAQDAVLHSQRDSVVRTAAQQRDSLAALELVAPHDGVFLLTAKWDGTKAEVGSTQVAGQEFGSLPDLNQLVAHFRVAEGQVFGLKTGLPVRVRLAGTGTELVLKVTRVGSNASTTSQESPVKYSDFDAAIDTATARKLGLKPGQALRGTVELVAQPAALTVPNIALVQDGAGDVVYTEEGGKQTRRKVELGQRGPVRSKLKSGVAAGARIVLLPPAPTEKS